MRHRLREPLIRHDAAPQTQRRAADSLRRRRFVDHPGRAHSLGATDVIDSSKGDTVAQLRELTGGRGVDHAFEAVGLPILVRQAVESLAIRGTATIVGVPPDGSELSFPFSAIRPECKVQTSRMGSNQFRLEFYRQGRLNLDDMVSRRGRLEDFNEAFRAMKAGEVARTVLTFDGVC